MCERCDGSGWIAPACGRRVVRCSSCGGTGEVLVEQTPEKVEDEELVAA